MLLSVPRKGVIEIIKKWEYKLQGVWLFLKPVSPIKNFNVTILGLSGNNITSVAVSAFNKNLFK